MRNLFCRALVDAAGKSDFVFLTGDLGYKALEPLRDVMGKRFINAGVAEQNMVSVAAGLARAGLNAWVYSIAPFAYARPFEQIRNDVCLHDLPVKIVGNGGGYGYGVMGATHHALEDYGVMLALQNMHAFVPAFGSDLLPIIRKLFDFRHPAYLRLGLSEQPADVVLPAYAPWRKLIEGEGATMIVVGPIAGSLLLPIRQMENRRRPNMWIVTELPIETVPAEFYDDLQKSRHLLVVEEHVANSGAGMMMAEKLMLEGKAPKRFTHRAALGYLSGCYGSQKYHRVECGLDPASIVELLNIAE